MDELQDMDSLLNGCRNIVEQFRDAEAMHASGAISDEEFYERQGRKNASLRVIAAIEGGSAVTEEEFKARGVNIVIYANQLTRAAFPAMQKTAEDILRYHRAKEVDDRLLPIKQIITLIDEI